MLLYLISLSVMMGFGVSSSDGERGSQAKQATDSKMYKLDKIYLISKPEYKKMLTSQEWEAAGNNIEEQRKVKEKNAIKVVHLEYDYSLCQGVVNNNLTAQGQTGKLTLKKVYFTYRNSNMGKYTPYTFDYGQFDANNNGVFENTAAEKINRDYHNKAYDIWGNYKAVPSNCGIRWRTVK